MKNGTSEKPSKAAERKIFARLHRLEAMKQSERRRLGYSDKLLWERIYNGRTRDTTREDKD